MNSNYLHACHPNESEFVDKLFAFKEKQISDGILINLAPADIAT